MEYRIFGPFALPTDDENKLDFTSSELKRFWSEAMKETGYDLQNGRGCYLYVVRAGKGITPWYVGQSKGPFSLEVFAAHKKEHYNSVYENYQKGTPMLFLIARFTKGNKLSLGKLNEREAKFVENLLIVSAYRKNPDLKNIQGVKFAQDLVVPGLFNDKTPLKKQSESTNAFKLAMGVET